MIIRNILWDMDGTLFDSYPAIVRAYLAALSERGIAAEEDWVRSLTKVSVGHATATLAERYRLDPLALAARFDEIYLSEPPEVQAPFPGVEAVLARVVERGGVNGIVTHRRPDSAARFLATFGYTHYFSGIVTPYEGFPRKPDPTLFATLVERLDLNPLETLGIGDRDLDIQSARGAGLLTAFFDPDGLDAVPDGADLVVRNYTGLLRLLDDTPLPD